VYLATTLSEGTTLIGRASVAVAKTLAMSDPASPPMISLFMPAGPRLAFPLQPKDPLTPQGRMILTEATIR
jgi:hypothetical protein